MNVLIVVAAVKIKDVLNACSTDIFAGGGRANCRPERGAFGLGPRANTLRWRHWCSGASSTSISHDEEPRLLKKIRELQ
jgi:hypothetical protein